MANAHILWNIMSDVGTYTRGSWVATLPLNNLKDRQPKKVARTTDDANASTRFTCDLGRLDSISMFALVNHNISSAGTVRLRTSTASDGSAPTIDVTINVSDFDDEQLPGGPIVFYQAAASVFARYVLIDINDTANPNGYVQIGRFLAGESFSPGINIAFGAGLSFVDESQVTRAQDKTRYTDIRPKRRQFSGEFGFLTEGEAIGSAFRIMNTAGITGGILLAVDPDDTGAQLVRRCIYGRLVDLSPIQSGEAVEAPYAWRFVIEELM